MKTKDKTTGTALQQHTAGLFDDMDRAFDAMMHRGWLRPFRELWPDWSALEGKPELTAPRVDVIDRDTEILVRAELPGIDKKDIHIDLTGSLLTLRGERHEEQKTEEGNYYRAEIVRGSFRRTLQLPTEVKADAADATFERGVLEIHLPKQEATKREKIAVK
jgi:HSP20 family protein